MENEIKLILHNMKKVVFLLVLILAAGCNSKVCPAYSKLHHRIILQSAIFTPRSVSVPMVFIVFTSSPRQVCVSRPGLEFPRGWSLRAETFVQTVPAWRICKNDILLSYFVCPYVLPLYNALVSNPYVCPAMNKSIIPNF